MKKLFAFIVASFAALAPVSVAYANPECVSNDGGSVVQVGVGVCTGDIDIL
jgi:hypothetical protein